VLTPRDALDALRLARLTACAWLGLAAFDLALLAGFARAYERIRAVPVNRRGRDACLPQQIIWAVDEACVWYVKRAPCLQRSAVAACLLRRHGVHAELVIGYRALPFESHAWVEVDGHIVNDRPQYQKFFTVLERL
jgi:hypothetical protein